MMTLAKHHGRRRRALFALILWSLGFEVAPNLHVGFHDLFAEHHHHGEEHADADSGHGDEDSPEHGEGSIEHRGVAILEAPPPPVIVQVFALEPTESHPVPVDTPADRRPQAIRERGPPLSS